MRPCLRDLEDTKSYTNDNQSGYHCEEFTLNPVLPLRSAFVETHRAALWIGIWRIKECQPLTTTGFWTQCPCWGNQELLIREKEELEDVKGTGAENGVSDPRWSSLGLGLWQMSQGWGCVS